MVSLHKTVVELAVGHILPELPVIQWITMLKIEKIEENNVTGFFAGILMYTNLVYSANETRRVELLIY